MGKKRTPAEDYDKMIKTQNFNKTLETIDYLKDFLKVINSNNKDTIKDAWKLIRKFDFLVSREEFKILQDIFIKFDVEKKFNKYEESISEMIIFYENALTAYR